MIIELWLGKDEEGSVIIIKHLNYKITLNEHGAQ
jgi:hypothetical protein